MIPPDRLVVAICRDCGLPAVAFTPEARKAGASVWACTHCSSKRFVYVRYQLVARAVEPAGAPRRPKRAKASPRGPAALG